MLRIDFVRPPNRIFSSGSLRSLVENPSLSRPEIAIFLRLAALAERTDTSSKIVSEAGRQALVHAKINCTGDATGRRKERASVWRYSSCAVRRADGRSDGPTDRLTRLSWQGLGFDSPPIFSLGHEQSPGVPRKVASRDIHFA